MTLDLTEWVQAIKQRNTGGLQLARLYHQVNRTPDFSLNELRAALANPPETNGQPAWQPIDLPSKQVLNRNALAYEYWVIQQNYSEEELSTIGMTKLYELRMALKDRTVQHEELNEWLCKARELTTQELKSEIGRMPLQQEFRVLRLPESVHDAFVEGVSYFVKVNDAHVEGVSDVVKGCEVLAGFLNDLKDDAGSLRRLWNIAHGEVDE